MSHLIDLRDKRFGRLTVIAKVPHLPKNTNTRWLCLCDCGSETEVAGCHLKGGKIQACGCLQKEKAAEIGREGATHGMSKTRLYHIWQTMKDRCYLLSNSSYINYGARGITVCEEWRFGFEAFRDWALSNGYKEDLTIERKNVNGNYCPENCTWATTYEQGLNRRDTIRIELNGQMVSLKEIYDKSNSPMSYDGVRWRMEELGWDLSKAINTPPWTGENAKLHKTIKKPNQKRLKSKA